MELDTASLWWAGKEIARGKKLYDFVGKNEKTKIVCKLQKVTDGHFSSVDMYNLVFIVVFYNYLVLVYHYSNTLVESLIWCW